MDLDKFKKQLEDTQEYVSEIESFLDKNFLIDGYTPTQWRRKLYIKIPTELNFQAIIQLAADIVSKYQIAARYRDSQTVQVAILERTKADKYNSAYEAARVESAKANNGKSMAAESCKIAANIEVKDLENAIGNQALVRDWWKNSCSVLTEMRKLAEILLRALASDANAERDFVVKIKRDD
jgi:hypothetical protein